MGNEDLGRHYQSIGELPKALEAFNRMRADASIQKHIVDVSKHTISVSIELRNWTSVLSGVSKIMTVPLSEVEEKATQPFLKVTAGLAHLAGGKFYDAASAFVLTNAGMGTTCNDIISSNDVAIYGGLCALASMGRDELQRKVLENSTFRTYLELEPHIRKAIQLFVNGRYSACLAILEGYRNDYFLDIHLAAHVKEIYYLIRSKSIVQYFIPFSCVTIDSLNEAFAGPEGSIVPELVEMIKRGSLVARIDTQNKVGDGPEPNINASLCTLC
jgi:COP9 signalosome complex subunit 1